MRPLTVIVVAAIALTACSTSSTGSTTKSLPDGVVAANGGGYCCRVDTTWINCEGAYMGGWSSTAEDCRGLSSTDDLLVSSVDSHGCAVLVPGGDGCISCLGDCPKPDASSDAAIDGPLDVETGDAATTD